MCLLNNSFPMYYHLSYCVLSKYHACEQEDGAAAHHIYAVRAIRWVQSAILRNDIDQCMDDRSHDRNCINSVLIN